MMRLRLLLPLLLAGAQKSRQRQACGNSARPEQTIKSVQKEGEIGDLDERGKRSREERGN
jgi:hypothetical protein